MICRETFGSVSEFIDKLLRTSFLLVALTPLANASLRVLSL